MKKYLLLMASVLLLAACSSPKYAYYFDYYDYNSGKKKVAMPTGELAQSLIATPELSPLQLDAKAVTASAESKIKKIERPAMVPTISAEQKALLQQKYSSLSRTEKKEFRKELKAEVKKIIKAKKSGESITAIADAKAMDNDLKMALIFAVVAIVLSAFGGVNSIFWILGVIATVVAIVFFIKWLAEQ